MFPIQTYLNFKNLKISAILYNTKVRYILATWLEEPYKEFTVHIFLCFLWRCGLTRCMASSLLRFLTHIKRRITVGRTPLDEWSARRRDLYLTTHNTHKRKTSMPPAGLQPTISAAQQSQTYALDSAATGIGIRCIWVCISIYIYT
jgi:hypothetical protein